jgi:hypothetical protein
MQTDSITRETDRLEANLKRTRELIKQAESAILKLNANDQAERNPQTPAKQPRRRTQPAKLYTTTNEPK